MESVGFKEWSIVCEALGRGRQSIILRKGGIAEGREGFSFPSQRIFSVSHMVSRATAEGARCGNHRRDADATGKDRNQIRGETGSLSHRSHPGRSRRALEPLHILKPEVVRNGLNTIRRPVCTLRWSACIRLVPTWTFPNEKKYGGCRSWVKLPDVPADLHFEPVLSDAEHAKRRREVFGDRGK